MSIIQASSQLIRLGNWVVLKFPVRILSKPIFRTKVIYATKIQNRTKASQILWHTEFVTFFHSRTSSSWANYHITLVLGKQMSEDKKY